MSVTPSPTPALARLAALREREMEQRQVELARHLLDTERRQRNQERLDDLWRTSTTSGTLTPLMSLNCANYKQTVLDLAHRHREDMALHEQVTAQARQSLVRATQRHGALDLVLTQQAQALAQAHRVQEQKHQDEIARQSWLRRGAR